MGLGSPPPSPPPSTSAVGPYSALFDLWAFVRLLLLCLCLLTMATSSYMMLVPADSIWWLCCFGPQDMHHFVQGMVGLASRGCFLRRPAPSPRTTGSPNFDGTSSRDKMMMKSSRTDKLFGLHSPKGGTCAASSSHCPREVTPSNKMLASPFCDMHRVIFRTCKTSSVSLSCQSYKAKGYRTP